MTELESDKGRPLTAEENAKLRVLLEKDDRVIWIWSSVRVWAMWIAAVLGGVYLTLQGLKDLVRWLSGSNVGV